MRYAAKTDANQHPIEHALRAENGAECVFDLSAVGKGCPDLMVGIREKTLLLEIKTDGGHLTPAQKMPGDGHWLFQHQKTSYLFIHV